MGLGRRATQTCRIDGQLERVKSSPGGERVGDEGRVPRPLRPSTSRRLSASEYQKQRPLCGNASQSQGDERDVMVRSLVDSPCNRPLPRRQCENTVKGLYGVAAGKGQRGNALETNDQRRPAVASRCERSRRWYHLAGDSGGPSR